MTIHVKQFFKSKTEQEKKQRVNAALIRIINTHAEPLRCPRK
jgi:hypothetical protein